MLHVHNYVSVAVFLNSVELHGNGHGGLFLMCSYMYILLSVTPQEQKGTQVKR